MTEPANEEIEAVGLWIEGDHHLYITKSGAVGMNVGGQVIVRPMKVWFETMQAALATRPAPAAEVTGERWQCFHCDKMFTDRASAEEHFGTRQYDEPLCAADLSDLKFARKERDEYADMRAVLLGKLHEAEQRIEAFTTSFHDAGRITDEELQAAFSTPANAGRPKMPTGLHQLEHGAAATPNGCVAYFENEKDCLAFMEWITAGAAGQPLVAEGWQPIETAPKDGSEIDLLYPYPRGRINNCFWSNRPSGPGWFWKTARWEKGELLNEDDWSWNSYPGMQPTHWMTSPAAPQPDEVKS